VSNSLDLRKPYSPKTSRRLQSWRWVRCSKIMTTIKPTRKAHSKTRLTSPFC